MAAFVDRVVVHVSAGNGGHGVASVHREKFKPLGGPDGGNGGDGGDVVLEVDPSVHTLLDFHHRPHQKAGNGRPGEGSNRHGGKGEDRVLRVPAGTVVSAPDGGSPVVPDGYRRFDMTFVQPVDHDHPEGAHFTQRLSLLHKAETVPMVLASSGYGIDPSQWGITRMFATNQLAVEHRIGRLAIGDLAVVIAAAAAHRAEAFTACRAMIDRLKDRVPIWKKEVGEDGAEWVGLGP